MSNPLKLPVKSRITAMLLFCALLFLSAQVNSSDALNLHEQPERNVIFYTSYGYQTNKVWRVPLRIWISKVGGNFDRILEKGGMKIIREKAGLTKLDVDQKMRYRKRVNAFLRDNDSGELVPFRFLNDPREKVFHLQRKREILESDFNGNIQGTFTLSKDHALELIRAQGTNQGWLKITTEDPEQHGEGWIRLIDPVGTSVISDIDDTIKVTEIPLGTQEVLKNTFFEPFQLVPEMLEQYNDYAKNVSFHYVSGGPWQLYQPISEFLFSGENRFRRGSLHMKNVRTNLFESDSYFDIGQLISMDSKKVTFRQKIRQISQLFEHFPGRQFILIGDSGELDPEIFNTIKRLYPKQVIAIKIRDVVNDRMCNKNRLADMEILEADLSQPISCEDRNLK